MRSALEYCESDDGDGGGKSDEACRPFIERAAVVRPVGSSGGEVSGDTPAVKGRRVKVIVPPKAVRGGGGGGGGGGSVVDIGVGDRKESEMRATFPSDKFVVRQGARVPLCMCVWGVPLCVCVCVWVWVPLCVCVCV